LPTTTPDAHLSPEALGVLLEHRDRFLAFLVKRTGSPALAEEILQDAFVRGFERGGALREEETAIAWFYRLLRNAVVDRARKDDARARGLERWASELASAPAGDDASRAQVCQCVMPLVDSLKPEYAEAIRAIDLDGLEVGALATQAQITANNASVRLHRAREALGRKVRLVCGACAVHQCVDCTCARASAEEGVEQKV
jgi:RNA polymerase sigma-70 factor (ECF subfamily)